MVSQTISYIFSLILVEQSFSNISEIYKEKEDVQMVGGYRLLKHYEDRPIPKHFDLREIWTNCPSLLDIQDQGQCHVAWAIVIATVMADRICIASNGTKKVRLSTQDLIACCEMCYMDQDIENNTCSDQENVIPAVAIEHAINVGVVTDACMGYDNKTFGTCPKKCTNPSYTKPYDEDKYKAFGLTYVDFHTPGYSLKSVQIEIMDFGPVISFIVPDTNIKNIYTDGVIRETNEHQRSNEGRAIKIIGWGEENGTNYWIVANSRGKKWGSFGGYFKIERGAGEDGAFTVDDYFIAPDMIPLKAKEKSCGCRKELEFLLVLIVLIFVYDSL